MIMIDRKRLFRIAAPLLVVIGGLAVLVYLATRDDSPPDTSDLILARPAVLPENNAYTYFLAATNHLHWPTNDYLVGDYLDGKPVDNDAVDDVIARNSEMLAIIKTGLQCRVYLTPESTDLYSPVAYVTSFRRIGTVMALNVKHYRLCGKTSEATDTCIDLMLMGNMIQKNAGSMLDYCLSHCVLILGIDQAADIARDKNTPAGKLATLSKTLTSLGSFDQGLINAFKGEYQWFAASNCAQVLFDERFYPSAPNRTIRLLLTNRLTRRVVYKPNRTKALFATLVRHSISNSPRNFCDVEPINRRSLGLPENMIDLLLHSNNAIGRLCCILVYMDHPKFYNFKCRVMCGVAAARLVLACNEYERANGKMPDSLQGLVPTYLPTIPRDPFDGKEFRYSPAKGIVYSVGKDLKDSGGSTNGPDGRPEPSRWSAEDYVYEVKEKK